MSSLSVQYLSNATDKPNPAKDMLADLQICYWKLPKNRGFERFVDFGLLLHEVSSNLKGISLYFPFHLKEEQVSDLGGKVADGNMLGHLFNADCKVSNVVQSLTCHTVEFYDEARTSFILYSFGKRFEIESYTIGSRLIILFEDLPDETNLFSESSETGGAIGASNIYIRFRLENINETDFGHTEPVSNDFLQSAFSKMEMLNFHINVFKEYPEEDIVEIRKGWNNFGLSKLEFSFVGSSEDEKVIGHKSYRETRLLDNKTWLSYLEKHNPKHKQCIEHHWKYDSDVPNNIFIRSVYSSPNAWKVLKYCLILILLNLLACGLYDLGKSFINTAGSDTSNTSVEVVDGD